MISPSWHGEDECPACGQVLTRGHRDDCAIGPEPWVAIDALVAEVERERARADRAEAALREIRYNAGEDWIDDVVNTALSAGSGGRETTLEVAWLVERGQPEGQTPTVWLDDSTAHAGWYGDWTEDANRATKFASREAAEAWMEQRPGSDPARAVEHGWYGH